MSRDIPIYPMVCLVGCPPQYLTRVPIYPVVCPVVCPMPMSRGMSHGMLYCRFYGVSDEMSNGTLHRRWFIKCPVRLLLPFGHSMISHGIPIGILAWDRGGQGAHQRICQGAGALQLNNQSRQPTRVGEHRPGGEDNDGIAWVGG